MKNLSVIFLLLSCYCVHAQLYVSNSGSDLNSGTIVAPLKTYTKALSLATQGSTIYLQRGNVFTEQTAIPWNGNEKVSLFIDGKTNISFDAYGEGSAPAISSFKNIASWENLSGKIWRSYLGIPKITTVLYKQSFTPIANIPVWYNIQSVDGGGAKGTNGTLTANFPYTDLAGGDIVVRKNQYILDVMPIVSQSGTSITFMNTGEGVQTDWGCFIQNTFSCLKKDGDWIYKDGYILMYFDVAPGDVQYAEINRMAWVLSSSNITFNNIEFRGANDYGIFSQRSNYISVNRCSFTGIGFCGYFDLPQADSKTIIIKDSKFTYCYSAAIDIGDQSSNCTVENNEITNCGNNPGSYRWVHNDNIFSSVGPAIKSQGSNSVIKYNRIKNVGHCGINFNGAGSIVQYNTIDSFALVVSDVGAIYTFCRDTTGKGGNRNVSFNKITNGIGNSGGTNAPDWYKPVMGIYLDDNSKNITVSDNSVSFCPYGIFVHNSKNNILTKNELINNAVAIHFNEDQTNLSEYLQIRDNTITENKIVFNSQQLAYEFRSFSNDFSLYGTIKGNYFNRSGGDSLWFSVTPEFIHTSKLITLGTLRTVYGHELIPITPLPIKQKPGKGNGRPSQAPFKTFPNPSTGLVKWDKVREFKVFNLSGNILIRGSSKQVDLSGLPNGAYVIELVDNNGYTWPFVQVKH